jgi:hypothetical protein
VSDEPEPHEEWKEHRDEAVEALERSADIGRPAGRETFVERMTTRLRTTYVPLRDRQPPEGPDQRENGEAEDEELEDRDGGLRVLPVERAADRNAPREPLAQLRDSAVEPASRRPTRWLADRCALERS